MAASSAIFVQTPVAESRKYVPELVQDDATPERLADEALTLLEHEDVRGDMIEKLKMIKRRLGRGGASERTARIAIEMMR